MAKYLHKVLCKFLSKEVGWKDCGRELHRSHKILPLLRPDSAVASHVGKTAFAEPAGNSKQDNRLWLLEITLWGKIPEATLNIHF